MNIKDKISNKFLEYGLELDDLQINMFAKYYDMLIEWNDKFNLTTITEIDEVIIKHFVDSVLPVKLLKENATLLDLGTGAGFPGIPLKIVRSDLNITLVDSLKKRTVFLEEVIKELQLENIEVVYARAEGYSREVKNREKFDYCVSRAVAKLPTLLELSVAMVKVGGYVVTYKSNNIDGELDQSQKAMDELSLRLDSVSQFEIKELETTRKILFFEKLKSTKGMYPRGKDKPRKFPI